jgi:hypothetical protein
MREVLLLFFPLTVRLVFGVQIAWLWILPAFGGDTIFFKDGMRTLCHGNAWEEKDEIHCEYAGGLITYSKNDVDRIERGTTSKNDSESNHTANSPGLAPPAGPGSSSGRASGILFYDPRRAKKFWSSATSHHDSYAEALAALATEFNRTVSWIEDHIGESNDLGQIRDILSARSNTSAPSSGKSINPAATKGLDFYNPRRPKKYWTSSEAHHDTLGQAIEALAAEFGKPTAWIERHMGEANDLEEIRQSLQKAQADRITQ